MPRLPSLLLCASLGLFGASCDDDGPCKTMGAVRVHGVCDCPDGSVHNVSTNACVTPMSERSERDSDGGRSASSELDSSQPTAAMRDSAPLGDSGSDSAAPVGPDPTIATAGCTPQPELCDGRDNNCNGSVDEELKNACGAACGKVVPPEDCTTTIDDNCDGQINEGCTKPPASCVPAREVCDGVDQDCNGAVDDGVRNECGACGAVPQETCDGHDNDCDGVIDEGLKNACGACGEPPAEVCDAKDNDCDGQVDEGCEPNSCAGGLPQHCAGVPKGQLAAGEGHACVVRSSRLFCWGHNHHGQLGVGDFDNRPSATLVPALADVVQVAAGREHTCARLASGRVACWGGNVAGQTGSSDLTHNATPIVVAGLADVVEIALGASHTCARVASGGVRCWGQNYNGELGDGTALSVPDARSATPTSVLNLPGGNSMAIAASGMAAHTCSIANSGTLSCWGPGFFGQLGNGARGAANVATSVKHLSGVQAAGVGNASSCAVTAPGSVSCWGMYDQRESFSDGTEVPPSEPVRVPALDGALEFAAGSSHWCARFTDGHVSCWGGNGRGQLGDGTQLTRNVPAQIPGLGGVQQIAAGLAFTCAQLSDARVQCWGANEYGQLGLGAPLLGLNQLTPTAVSGL